MKLKPIGYFSKAHGLKGHLILFTNFAFKKKPGAVFIEQAGSQAPYFVQEFKAFNKGFLLKLETIDDVNSANALKNKEVLAEEKYLEKTDDFEFTDFTLIDELKGEVGQITGLEENAANPLLVINAGGKEILLPFNEDLITKVVKTKKQLFYKAPEGLIDLYLES